MPPMHPGGSPTQRIGRRMLSGWPPAEEHGRSMAMNESDFEAGLKADGYTEIERQVLEPRSGKGRHRHHFAIRGLVLAETFVVTKDTAPVTFGAGEIFSVSLGELHDESIGPDGARVLVGRKFADAK